MENQEIDLTKEVISLFGKKLHNLPTIVVSYPNLKRLILKQNLIKNLPTKLGHLNNLQFLDYSQNCLTNTPLNLWNLKSLKTLIIETNLLTTLDSRLSSLVDLESLRLRKNNLYCLPQSFSSFKFLKYLDLGNNVLKKLPVCICHLEHLTTLLLDQNRLRELPKDFNRLQSLNKLVLSFNDFVEFPNEPFQNLTNLKTLEMNGCELIEIGDSISNLINLVFFSVRSNRISSVSEKISNLDKLAGFDLTNNLLTQLPSTVSNLCSLKIIKISKNRFSQFPKSILQLPNLTHILAWEAGLQNIPYIEEDGNSKQKSTNNKQKGDPNGNNSNDNKEEKEKEKEKKEENENKNEKEKQKSQIKLDIQYDPKIKLSLHFLEENESKNGSVNNTEKEKEKEKEKKRESEKEKERIIEIDPQNITNNSQKTNQIPTKEIINTNNNSKLGELTFFELGNNNLKKLPEELFVKLKKLRRLSIQKNYITELPETIYNIPQLWIINVINNPILEISSKIQQLQNLVELNFQSALLKTIPAELYLCQKLKKLNLCNNKLKDLPKGISNLDKLSKLNLSLNKFETFPLEILKLFRLNILRISGNQLTAIPDTITKHLYNLTELDMSNNELYFFPKYILQYGVIRKIYFSCNNISNLPDQMFFKISDLNISPFLIDLSHNKLTSFDSNWKNVPLRGLDISHNNINKIENTVFGENTMKLETFKVSHNNAFIDLPFLSELPNLKILHLEGNTLSKNLISVLNNEEIKDNEDNESNDEKDEGIKNAMKENKNNNNINNNKNNGGGGSSNKNNNNNFNNNLNHVISRFYKGNGGFTISPNDGMKNKKKRLQSINDLIVNPEVPFKTKKGRHLFVDEKYCPFFKIGYSEMQGLRQDQEDSIAIHPMIKKNIHYFAVFDGHGGSDVSNYAADKLGELLINEINDKIDNEEQLETDTLNVTQLTQICDTLFKEFNQTLNQSRLDLAGSTAVMVLIIKNKLYSINLGDSRAILIDNKGKAIQITDDHKPTNRDELLRIKFLRGTVSNNGRINGGLAVSRGFGDRDFQPWISAKPVIKCFDLAKEDRKYLVLACDGVWDVLSSQDVADIVMENANLNVAKIATKIKSNAYSKESTDNISVIVIDLLPNIDMNIMETQKSTDLQFNDEKENVEKRIQSARQLLNLFDQYSLKLDQLIENCDNIDTNKK
ncbi:leucine-rich repeat-containing protein [Anaeramoeba flamelloides]|uniref:Leucine-rich repeat-containing protein n=1 Tax=Anaeramoeba flamelloides TaxID=1746091 RepID=A0ABQ8Y2K0_9EUKA|nr:leucine-rich repeat-containing protein [Anaeramoeba flamelloides]